MQPPARLKTKASLAEKPEGCSRRVLAIGGAFFILGQYMTPFWRSKVKYSRNRQFFNFALVYFKIYESQRHKTFTSVFPFNSVQSCMSLKFPDAMFVSARTVSQKGTVSPPRRQNRMRANWVNGPDWHRIV